MEAHEVMKTWQYFLWWSDFVDVVLCECGCDTEQSQHFSWIFWAWNSFFYCVPAPDFSLFAFCCLQFLMDSLALFLSPAHPLRPIVRSLLRRKYSSTSFTHNGLGCYNSGLCFSHIANETLSSRIRCYRRRFLFGEEDWSDRRDRAKKTEITRQIGCIVFLYLWTSRKMRVNFILLLRWKRWKWWNHFYLHMMYMCVYLLAFPHMHANTDAHNIPCKFNSILEILIYLFIISTRLVCVSLCVVHEHIVSSCIESLCGSIGGRVWVRK